jgi:primosomal protein N' (replication factor Y) (superfamily II helicase)
MNTRSRYIQVILPLPLTTEFTYLVPDHLVDSAEIGRRVLAPFGPRVLTGFIVGTGGDSVGVERSKLKPVMDIIDDAPIFDHHMLAFARWLAEYYMCSTGEVLKAAMPPGAMVQSKLRVYRGETPLPEPNSINSLQEAVLEALAVKDGILIRTLERMIHQPVSGAVRALEKNGYLRIEQELSEPSVKPKTERFVFPTFDRGAVSHRARKQIECLDIIENAPDGIPLADLLERHRCTRGVVNAVVESGAARYEEIEITRRSKLLDQEQVIADFPLTNDQRSAVDMILEHKGSNHTPVLLHGVTGSGKTRVYIELVKTVLALGKGALILVPEIALTPQTTRFFTSVFPGKVAVMHSAMSPGERYDMWRTIHAGNAPIVIGPRSAVFAPVAHPGIIVVDEEHDASYKQTDSAPRYHARDAAVYRAHLLDIPVVLGTATPSMETWHNVLTGKYRLAELPHRIEKRPLPEVITVDMTEERKNGNYSSLSVTLREEIARHIERAEKSIILINRRGFAASVHCQSCGYVLTCPDCAVGLTYHASRGLAVCHLCGHQQIVLEHCPECGESKIVYRGMGTQKIEEELEKVAGHGSVIRMDSDTTTAHDSHFRLLEEFRNGPAPILLGTQMVAKGLDIHDVTLVGIVSADLSLYLPDFRAFERTFQLIAQVAGRAGRGDMPGIVVLQTYKPDNHAISAASRHDFHAFANSELEARRELSFPPYSRLILIEFAAEVLDSLNTVATDIARYLSANVPEDVEVLGPVDAPIARIRGKHRLHILVKSKNPGPLKEFIRNVIVTFSTGKEDVKVDVDPLDLM